MTHSLLEEFIKEVVAAGPDYARKEDVRQKLQNCLQEAIDSGEIPDEESLQSWWKTLDMAAMALRKVPFAVWRRMSKR